MNDSDARLPTSGQIQFIGVVLRLVAQQKKIFAQQRRGAARGGSVTQAAIIWVNLLIFSYRA